MKNITTKLVRDQRAIGQNLRWYTPLAILFSSLLVVVNIVAQKILPGYKWLAFNAGDLIYPLLYLVSLLIVEVYGYALSRRVIWSSFVSNLLVMLLIEMAIKLPAATKIWHDEVAFQLILGRTYRIMLASMVAFLGGEFLSTYLFSKLKIATDGKLLWFRSGVAVIIGQLLDSLIFTSIAFYGLISGVKILSLSFGAYVAKLICQLILTPVIYLVTRILKKAEGIDIIDRGTNFNPFNLG